MKQSVFLWISVVVIILGALIRLHKFPTDTAFNSDQGSDLLVARAIVKDGNRPLVGPLLSVDALTIPPTYYYLLASFLAIGRTIEGTAIFFYAMSLLSVFIFYYVAKSLMGISGGIIGVFMYAISVSMVFHSRNMWQPHPVQFFLLLYLYFIILAFDHKNDRFLIVALINFAIALTIYPSPLLLFPHVIFQSVRYFSEVKKFPPIISVISGVLIVVAACAPFYVSVVYFEWINNFSFLRSISSQSFGFPASLNDVFITYMSHLILLLNSLFQLKVVSPINFIAWVSVLGLVFCFAIVYIRLSLQRVAGQSVKKYMRVFDFIQPVAVVFGLIPLIYYRHDYYEHRLLALFPFLLILLVMTLRFAFEKTAKWYAVIACILGFGYFIGNAATLREWLFFTPNTDIVMARSVAWDIHDISKAQGVSLQDTTYLCYTVADVSNYCVYPVLYILREQFNYPLSFVLAGNDLPRYSYNTPNSTLVFLTCRGFYDASDVRTGCTDEFVKRNPFYAEINSMVIGSDYFVVFRRK